MREVAAFCEREAEERVARLHEREVHSRVGLRAGVRLHVGELRAEERFQALDGKRFGDVDKLTAAGVTTAGVALCVFVGELRALGLHDRDRGVVLGGDQFDVVFLALIFSGEDGLNFRVDLSERQHKIFGTGSISHGAFPFL